MPIINLEISHRELFPSLPSSWVVLDIGGWHRPLNRADFVIDIMPYETRNWQGAWDGTTKAYGLPIVAERFDKRCWIQRDICDRVPLPFNDKEIDFCVASEILEDVRDPIWVCSEMNRIAKAGFISCPHKDLESARGVNSLEFAGSWHHRWVVEIVNNVLVFTHKSPLLWEGSNKMVDGVKSLTALWKGEFEFKEQFFFTPEEYIKWTHDA